MLETIGTIGGIVASIAAVLGLLIAVINNNRTARREYTADVQNAYDRGRASRDSELAIIRDELNDTRDRLDYWRNIARGLEAD